jgi:hypothetical protein
MTKRDYQGFIVDMTGDGGDSAHFAGMSALFGNMESLEAYVIKSGDFIRHPTQVPWTNPKNFTNDQMCPLIAGLHSQGQSALVKQSFFKAAKRFFFQQNFERDQVGSTKYLWPHEFYKDSRPSSLTIKKTWSWKEFKFKGWLSSNNTKNYIVEDRTLDFADPIGISTIWHMILCGEIKYLYFLGLIGYPALAIAIMLHGLFNKSDDEGQIISKAMRAGRFFVWLYKKFKPDYSDALHRYFVLRRDMPEMYLSIISGLEN